MHVNRRPHILNTYLYVYLYMNCFASLIWTWRYKYVGTSSSFTTYDSPNSLDIWTLANRQGTWTKWEKWSGTVGIQVNSVQNMLSYSGWWLNRPIWNIWVKMGFSSPILVVNKTCLSCHHLVLHYNYYTAWFRGIVTKFYTLFEKKTK